MRKNMPAYLASPLKRSGKKTPNKKISQSKKEIVYSRLKAQPTSEPLEDYQPAEGLFDDEKDVEGKNIFHITPRKIKKSANTPAKTTPKSKTKTPSSNVESKDNLHRKMKRELANLKLNHVESDLEDSDEMTDSEGTDSENNTADKDNTQLFSGKSKQSFPETYFSAQRQKKAATSNRTLSNLKVKQTNIEELREILKNSSEFHTKQKDLLFKHYKSYFRKWLLLLKQGFNVLLYGVGSKQKILNEFCKDLLDDSLYIVIHGFLPSLNIKQILNSITEEALEYDGKFSNINEQTEYIKKYFSKGNEELYLIIHNIDGVRLRNVKTQAILSSLAASLNIHVLCSVDHINSPLIWNQIMLSQFKWVWFDVTTFEPYIIETSFEDSIFKDQSSHLLLSSLLHVYQSLTPNSQGVFLILAKHQQEQQNSANSGITFHEWYQECREAFLVNSEISMQAQISEFKNHKLLTSKKSFDGIELWYIPVDNATLEQFLENCK